MTEIDRRSMLALLGAAPLAGGFTWTDAEAARAQAQTQQAKPSTAKPAARFQPAFFTPHEYATVTVLVDLIIPKDERSGSATDAGVPQFVDFIMQDQPARQVAMRGGLAWLDLECLRRYDRTFVDCAPADRTAVLDDIAWPDRAKPEFSQGVAFFNSCRDLTAAGFWSSRMGVEDLPYLGNTAVEWNGCPDAVLKKLGIAAPHE